ncbi:MAG: Fe-S cluster assembly ATPase SufC [Candidatus Aenigmarchaeota archaeon]|nr:Fe-S cluster assembly ATPase SufC [Candidatus Aenigmarchaeota archaeon]
MTSTLEVKDLFVSVDGKQILKGVNLTIKQGEVHAIMGPNGSGKSTLAYALMGHPKYKIDSGQIFYNGEEITNMPVDERAKKGLFLAFQYPLEIQGVSYSQFLLAAMKSKNNNISIPDFKKLLNENADSLHLDRSFLERHLNVGFSGGEKKRAEILQMLMLKPELAVLDETDSGLDIDSLKIVAEAVNKCRGQNFGCLVITHYQRLLNYLRPDIVHVFLDGKIVETGDKDLAIHLEHNGYKEIMKKYGHTPGLSVIND